MTAHAAAHTSRASLAGPSFERTILSLGATPTPGGVHFSLFSTVAAEAKVRLFHPLTGDTTDHALLRTAPALFSREIAGVRPGALYKFVLDGVELPDPYARFLPQGVHGPARVEVPVTPPATDFTPRPTHQWVIYELHVGTFTREGTYRAAAEKLDHLQALGVSAIELMPVASFAGSRGWGYDGVAFFAPFEGYGEPDDLRAFVAAAHARGIAVLLDVVYNHVGPAGNYLTAYAPEYLAKDENGWGARPDFAEPQLRLLVLDNARYWLKEFDFDGLRLDATHAIVDRPDLHILTQLSNLAHSFARPRIVIAEDARNDSAVFVDHGLDGVWSDDFHHVARVTVTGEQEGYYAAYHGGAIELARVIERGWLYEGQRDPLTGNPRGAPCTLPKDALVYCIENHDQVGNRALGNRLTDDMTVEAYAGLSTLLLFLPAIPLLFMGQEWAASSPFMFFTDHDAELGAAIAKGRREEFKGFVAFDGDAIPDPQALSTFEQSRLDWKERESGHHAQIHALYANLLALRATDDVLSGVGTVTATAEDGLLVVTRAMGEERRVLLYNPSGADIRDSRVADASRILLASAPIADGVLPAYAAVILTGRV